MCTGVATPVRWAFFNLASQGDSHFPRMHIYLDAPETWRVVFQPPPLPTGEDYTPSLLDALRGGFFTKSFVYSFRRS